VAFHRLAGARGLGVGVDAEDPTTRLANDSVDQWLGALRLFQTYAGL